MICCQQQLTTFYYLMQFYIEKGFSRYRRFHGKEMQNCHATIIFAFCMLLQVIKIVFFLQTKEKKGINELRKRLSKVARKQNHPFALFASLYCYSDQAQTIQHTRNCRLKFSREAKRYLNANYQGCKPCFKWQNSNGAKFFLKLTSMYISDFFQD